MEMDRSIRARFPDDRHVLGPFLGNLPPEILDVVVQKLGWFRTTFAMAGRACREAVERVPSAREVVLTEEEYEQFENVEMELHPGSRRWPLLTATGEGDVEALEWLIQLFDAKGLEWRDGSQPFSWFAAGRGQIESLQNLHKNGCRWDGKTCAEAAWRGDLEMLQWARRNGCPWDDRTCLAAAGRGHLEVLQWAHQNGCPWNAGTCARAAGGGHLEVLQWARRNGCPWNARTCNAAAKEGHLEVLQWAHQNGCPWDELTLELADPRCRPYLLEHVCK